MLESLADDGRVYRPYLQHVAVVAHELERPRNHREVGSNNLGPTPDLPEFACQLAVLSLGGVITWVSATVEFTCLAPWRHRPSWWD